MAEVELQAVISVDIETSKKNIKRQVEALQKEANWLLKDIQIKVWLNDAQLKKETDKAIQTVQQTAQQAQPKIKPTVDIDLTAERAKFNQIQTTARDTGKVIDQELKGKLELDVAQATLVLKQIRQEIRNTTDKDQLIRLNIEARNVQSALTETKRNLNNLQNIWDTATSRLQAKFNWLWDVINANGQALQSLLAGDVIWWIQWLGTAFAWASTWAKWLLLALGPITVALWAFALAFSTFWWTARSFETAFTWVAKVIDGTDEQIATLRSQLEWLTTELPNSFENLSAIAESGARLWVPIENLAEFTRVVAWLEVATGVAADQIATDFARIANITGLPLTQVANLWSALTALGNNFATSEGEIIAFSNRIAWAWNLVWITAQEIFWIATAFTSVWLTAEAGWSSISKAFLEINNAVATWWDQLQRFATIAGVSGDEFSRIFRTDATEAFTLFVEWLGRQWENAGVALDGVLWKSSELQRTFLSIAGNTDVLREAVDLANLSFEQNTALQDEVNTRLATADSQLAILANRRRLVGASIWQAVVNVAVPALQSLSNFFLVQLPKWVFWFQRVLAWLFATFDTVFGSLPQLWATALTWLARVFQKWFLQIANLAWRLAGALWLDELQKQINSFSVTRIEIDTWWIDAFKSNYQSRLDEINKAEQSFFAKSQAISDQAVNEQSNKIRQSVQADIDAINDLLGWQDQPTWWWARRTTDDWEKQRKKEQEDFNKALQEEQRIFSETQKKKRDLLSQERQLLQDFAKFTRDQTKKTYDDTLKEIDRIDKAITDYDKKIQSLQASLASLDVDTDVSIAQRVIELNKLLDDQNLSQEKRLALQQELALATANTTQEEIDRQKALSEESTTERILREAEEKRIALQAELDAEIQARDREVQALADATAKKEEIQRKFFDQYKTDIDDAYNKELNKLDEVKTKLQEIRALRQQLSIATGAGGTGVWWWATGSVTVNNNPTINIPATINNDADIDDLGRRVVEHIFNGAKGIL